MSNKNNGAARAVADLGKGQLLASVEVAATPKRVFHALTSTEIGRMTSFVVPALARAFGLPSVLAVE